CGRRQLNWKRRGGQIDGPSLDSNTPAAAPASGARSMQDWVGEAREVRVNAPEVANRTQEEAAFLDQRFGRVGIGETARCGGSAQEAHAQCRGGGFELTELPLTRGQSLRVPGLGLQENGQREAQALEQLAVACGG